MKAKTQRAIKTILEKLGAKKQALGAASKAWETYHDQVHRLHGKETKARKEADKLRREGHEKKAVAKDARSMALRTKRVGAQAQQQNALGEVKRLTGIVNNFEKDLAAKQKELAELTAVHGVKIEGNKARGGTHRQRLQSLALASANACAAGDRRNFYSQSGGWSANKPITGESYGDRSDCSQWVTSIFWGAGLDDPNGNEYRGGYTGTLASHGKAIPESEIKPGDLILYGSAPFHHVELYVGPGSRTIGHGSPPIDAGVIALLPGPRQVRSYA